MMVGNEVNGDNGMYGSVCIINLFLTFVYIHSVKLCNKLITVSLFVVAVEDLGESDDVFYLSPAKQNLKQDCDRVEQEIGTISERVGEIVSWTDDVSKRLHLANNDESQLQVSQLNTFAAVKAFCKYAQKIGINRDPVQKINKINKLMANSSNF